MKYEAVIGLEVHVQLRTESKMFTRAPYRYGEEPNTLTDPVVLGMPGVLPVLNLEAIRKSIQVGLLFDSEIPELCKWDRKHYFYPDMPKNYQISQYDQPICVGGFVEIELEGESRNVMGEHKRIELTRAHLEEDVGKLTHAGNESLVDYNRAGAPLLEIVTEPVIRSADEAYAFLTSLRLHLQYAGLADCDMEKGGLRCDANISIRPVGEEKLGTKVELKNLNSITGVRNGIEYEIRRQIRAVESNERIEQQTRRWDADKGITSLMRTKEYAHDYRYFPDPDLMPVQISSEMRESLREALPEKPFDKQRRLMEQYGLPYTVTSVLYPLPELADFFEQAVGEHDNPKLIANWVTNDLQRVLTERGVGAFDTKISPQSLAALVRLIDKGVISKQIASEVFADMLESGDAPTAIVERKGLKQTSDTGELEALVRETIAANPKPVEQYRAGNEKAINALKGPIMKATRGKANPAVVDALLKKCIDEG